MKGRLAPFALLAVLLLLPAATAAPVLIPVEPEPGGTVRTTTPTIRVLVQAGFPDSAIIVLDGVDMREYIPEAFTVNATGLTLAIPNLLPLKEGRHNLTVTVSDETGAATTLAMNFTIDLTPPPSEGGGISSTTVILFAAGGIAVLLAGGAAAYAYARARHRFTFRRHFLRHPEHVRWLVLYVPTGIAVLTGLVALYLASGIPDKPQFLMEYVVVAAAIGAVLPFAIDTARRARRTRACEKAFAQFLFEVADAVRGGIDPTRAILEMAKTQDGLLREPIRRAADAIRLGRPLDDALQRMTAGIGSPLVARYASLVGEAAQMGGGIAGVLQRAARDMEEMTKVRDERNRQMATPVMTMYMSFFVLLLMLIQLVNFAPNLGDIDLGALGGGDAPKVPRIPTEVLQDRIFHLLLLNAAGGGLLVGAFREGKLRHGLLHAVAMVAAAALLYPLAT